MKDLVLAPSPLNPETVADLAARVAAATGPNGALDHAILRACGYQHAWTPTEPGRSRFEWVADDRPAIGWAEGHVTASVDAALGLIERVLPGACCSAIKLNGPCEAYIWPEGASGYLFQRQGRANTPALALLAALLETLAKPFPASEREGDGARTQALSPQEQSNG